MNNKGVVFVTMYVIGGLLITAALLFIVISINQKAANPLLLDASLSVNDLTNTIDVIGSIPNEVHYEYPQTLIDHEIIIKGTSVVLLAEGEEYPMSDFSLKKSYFSKMDNINFDSDTVSASASKFFLHKTKEGDFTLNDFEKDSDSPLINTKRERPYIKVEAVEVGKFSIDQVLKELTLNLKSDINAGSIDAGELTILITMADNQNAQENIIYYSKAKNSQTRDISINIARAIKDFMSKDGPIELLSSALEKDYDEKMVVELVLKDSRENINLFSSSENQRHLSYLVSNAINNYYDD